MGKKSKEHRKKVANRNTGITNSKKSAHKIQEDFIKQVIERERENGNFEQPDILTDSTFSVLEVDGPTI